jgi:predicted amidohydrolase
MTRIALLQMTSGIDPLANARTIVAAMEAAAADGARLLFTPEMSGLLDRDRARAAGAIGDEPADAVLAAVREAAARLRLWVHLGSLALRPEPGAPLYANRTLLVDDRGAIRARYDKIHLFDVDLPTGERWRESAAYAPGGAAVVADTPAGALGFSICYDMRFPDLYRALSDAGAEILAVPAAFTVPTGEAHWHVLLRARAIESGCFVVAAAQVGVHEDGRRTYGHSLVVDPWGQVLLDMAEAPGLAFAEIDLTQLRDVRARIPALAHRRPIPPVERVA